MVLLQYKSKSSFNPWYLDMNECSGPEKFSLMQIVSQDTTVV